MTKPKKARGVGRPAGANPRTGAGGKGRVLSANISQKSRDLLEAEAARTGFSISQIADRWLQAAGEGAATYEARLGGDAAMVAAHERLAEISRLIEAQISDKLVSRVALRRAWERAVPLILPRAPLEQSMIAEMAQWQAAWASCHRVLDVLDNLGPADPVHQRARKAEVKLGGQTSIAIRMRSSPNSLQQAPDESVLRDLEALKEAGVSAGAEIDRAICLVRGCLAIQQSRHSQLDEALKLIDHIVDYLRGEGDRSPVDAKP
jgi:hypothetical protein